MNLTKTRLTGALTKNSACMISFGQLEHELNLDSVLVEPCRIKYQSLPLNIRDTHMFKSCIKAISTGLIPRDSVGTLVRIEELQNEV